MKWFKQWWPWNKIRQLNNELLNTRCVLQELQREVELVKAERNLLKVHRDELETHRVNSQKAFAMLGIFIKRRHALNIDETRLQQFIK